MGLLDVLNGMQNGPRGQREGSGGMSPIAMALLGLLAYKAVKSMTGAAPGAAPAGTGRGGIPGLPPGTTNAGLPGGGLGGALGGALGGGGLGDLLKGGLGGLLAGGAAGTVLGGGLADLLKQFEQSGHGEAANSWVGTGPNKDISPKELESAIGSEKLNSGRTGRVVAD